MRSRFLGMYLLVLRKVLKIISGYLSVSVVDCVASDGLSKNEIILSDENGCPVNGSEFPIMEEVSAKGVPRMPVTWIDAENDWTPPKPKQSKNLDVGTRW